MTEEGVDRWSYKYIHDHIAWFQMIETEVESLSHDILMDRVKVIVINATYDSIKAIIIDMKPSPRGC